MKTANRVAVAALLLTAACKNTPDASTPPPHADQSTEPAPTSEPAVGSTEQVLDRHLEAFGKDDLAGLLADYADDAALITPQGTVRGHAGLQSLFEGLLAEFGKPGTKFTLAQKHVRGELAYITWSAETADNVYELATDTFVIVGGKIVAQTFAGKITARNPAEASSAASPPPALEASATQQVLSHHLDAFGQRKIDAILSDYTPESVFLGQAGEVIGAEQLSPVFQGLFDEFAKPGAKFTMQTMAVEGDVAFIVWSAETADNVYEWATDTFVVRDGKIAYQTLAAKVSAKQGAVDPG